MDFSLISFTGFRFLRRQSWIIVLALATLIQSCQCSKDDSNKVKGQTSEVPGSSSGELSQEDLVAKGKSLYSAVCISCHNINPKLAGSLGPDVFGSSRELLEAKVISGTYPPGYKPKRTSGAMTKFSFTAKQIDSLAAYLNSSN